MVEKLITIYKFADQKLRSNDRTGESIFATVLLSTNRNLTTKISKYARFEDLNKTVID